MAQKNGSWHQFRARSPLQRAVIAILVLVEVAGIVAVATGHRDLGTTLIGLGIVSLGPFLVWTRRTEMPHASRDQVKD